MIRLSASCLLEFQVSAPTTFLFMLRPRSSQKQWVVREEYLFSPTLPVHEHLDSFGNLCQRLVASEGDLRIHSSVEVDLIDPLSIERKGLFVPIERLPHETLTFLYPSRYCDSDVLSDLAFSITEYSESGYDQCAAILEFIKMNIRYSPGDGEISLTASSILEQGHGVCRDLAHLGIALCRAISIPSRLVVGYLEGLQPMDLHAWYEVYVGGQWHTFDPTQPELNTDRITIATGRDAADVSVYTQFGLPLLPTKMEVKVHGEGLQPNNRAW